VVWISSVTANVVTGLVLRNCTFRDPIRSSNIEGFGIYEVGFVRPPDRGSDIGHFRLTGSGRKAAALIATLLLRGSRPSFVAFVPTNAKIGIWGAIILTVGFIQGVASAANGGGRCCCEWSGSRTDHHRGFMTRGRQFGVTGRPGVHGEIWPALAFSR